MKTSMDCRMFFHRAIRMYAKGFHTQAYFFKFIELELSCDFVYFGF